MRTVQINVGLDFGTHQTKVCIQIEEGQGKKYEFVPLNPNQDGIDAVLLPSLVHVMQGGRFEIGEPSGNPIKSYGFFKIASAEDEEFHTDLELEADKYDKSAFYPYHPEQLAVIYVAGVILRVRNHVRKTHLQQRGPAARTSFLGQTLAATASDTEVVWRYQMGVPTEYHSPRNAKRKRKFEQILLLALAIADQFETEYEHATLPDLCQALENHHRSMMREVGFDETNSIDPDDWKSYLADRMASIFPETAAGLVFLVRTGKLETNKYYLAMDIGGGSTDISFFKAERGGTFTYLASKSVMLAANDVSLRMGVDSNLLHMRQHINQLFETPDIAVEPTYKRAYGHLSEGVNVAAYRMFNSDVYSCFPKTIATEHFKDSTCYLYGGGSLLPEPDNIEDPCLRRIRLHDNGVKHKGATVLYATVAPIEGLTFTTERIANEGWESQMRILIVCLGLSLSLPNDQMVDYVVENFSKPQSDGSPFSNMFDFPKAKWV